MGRARTILAGLSVGALALASTPAPAHEPAVAPIAPFSTTVPTQDGPVSVSVHGDPVEAMGLQAAAAQEQAPERLAGSWCGDVTGSDDVIHETGLRAAAKIKVIEAVPADASPSAEHRNDIQAAVGRIIDQLVRDSGNRRSLRFDLGTRCGPKYVDILTMKLPKTAAQYGAGACNTGPLFSDARARLPEAPGPRNYLLFALSIDCGAIAGYATLPRDDTAGPGNRANDGGYLAVTFYAEGRTALHEAGHNLGAVQPSAPHSDLGGHCWDNFDVMCYPYTTLLPQSPLRPCANTQPYPFDCQHDDYFNPSPAPGSYLATHWNVYDSVFMCEVATCVQATPQTEPAAPAPPAAVTAPPAPSPTPSPQPTPAPTSQPADSARSNAPSRKPSSRSKKRRKSCRTKAARRTKRCRALARRQRASRR